VFKLRVRFGWHWSRFAWNVFRTFLFSLHLYHLNLCQNQNKCLLFVAILADFCINRRLQVYRYFYRKFILLRFVLRPRLNSMKGGRTDRVARSPNFLSVLYYFVIKAHKIESSFLLHQILEFWRYVQVTVALRKLNAGRMHLIRQFFVFVVQRI